MDAIHCISSSTCYANTTNAPVLYNDTLFTMQLNSYYENNSNEYLSKTLNGHIFTASDILISQGADGYLNGLYFDNGTYEGNLTQAQNYCQSKGWNVPTKDQVINSSIPSVGNDWTWTNYVWEADSRFLMLWITGYGSGYYNGDFAKDFPISVHKTRCIK